MDFGVIIVLKDKCSKYFVAKNFFMVKNASHTFFEPKESELPYQLK